MSLIVQECDDEGALLPRAGEGHAKRIQQGTLSLRDGVLRHALGFGNEAGEAFAGVHGAMLAQHRRLPSLPGAAIVVAAISVRGGYP